MKDIFVSCLFLSLCAFGAGCSSDDSQEQEMMNGGNPPGTMNPDQPGTPDPMPSTLPTEFMVMRVGTGTAALQSNVAAAAFLERRKIADGSLVGQPIALPTALNGNNHPLTLSGTGVSEGALTLSSDGHYLLFAGYEAAPDTAAVIDSAMRVIGRLSKDGNLDTTTVVDGLNGSGNSIRSAASPDGNSLWISGVLGVAYTTLGSIGVPSARPLGSAANSRVIGFYDGQLYVSRASDSVGGISMVGTGGPTTDNVAAKQLPGFPSGGNVLSPFGFVAFDRDGAPGIDLLYVADDRTDGNGGIQRWKLANNTWTLEGTISVGAASGCRGLAGFVDGSTVVLVTSTSEVGAPTRLAMFRDSGGAPDMLSGQQLAIAAASTAFRGVALPPAP